MEVSIGAEIIAPTKGLLEAFVEGME